MYKLSDFYDFLIKNGFTYVARDFFELNEDELFAFQREPHKDKNGHWDEDLENILAIPYFFDPRELGVEFDSPKDIESIYEHLLKRGI